MAGREGQRPLRVGLLQSDKGGVPADLPVSGLRAGVETWAFRNAEILTIDGIEQIFPF